MTQVTAGHRIPRNTGTVQTTVKMPTVVRSAAEAEAARRGLTLSRYLAEVLCRDVGMPIPWEGERVPARQT